MRSLLLFALMLAGCSTVRSDPSLSSAMARDVSLIETSCSGRFNRGMETCWFHEGDPVTTIVQVQAPWPDDAVYGEMRVKHGDQTKTYEITGHTMMVPLADLVGKAWMASDVGLVQIVATVKTKSTIVQSVGYVFIVILDKGYDPVPMDDAETASTQTCVITYTDKGRSKITCRP